MKYLTLVNRTERNLNGTWDGRQYVIEPGKHQFPEIQAQAFKRQNPVMGSEDPYSLRMLYLMGIVEEGDDTSPIEQSAAVERFDRSKMGGDRGKATIERGHGTYGPLDKAPGLPINGSFVTPTS
jgi:hypothetical protein